MSALTLHNIYVYLIDVYGSSNYGPTKTLICEAWLIIIIRYLIN
jgi:hypothetical protein